MYEQEFTTGLLHLMENNLAKARQWCGGNGVAVSHQRTFDF